MTSAVSKQRNKREEELMFQTQHTLHQCSFWLKGCMCPYQTAALCYWSVAFYQEV